MRFGFKELVETEDAALVEESGVELGTGVGVGVVGIVDRGVEDVEDVSSSKDGLDGDDALVTSLGVAELGVKLDKSLLPCLFEGDGGVRTARLFSRLARGALELGDFSSAAELTAGKMLLLLLLSISLDGSFDESSFQ